ncbi:hypothetical protein [Bradyrhizobium sp. Leo170]|uniref:hypothetical protein n=1 Tax=Bradyrhizobium sp. Leo170 TaxID=1571199 RepID=UPI00102E6C7B|nr:hypothetical protein [Bradyrhizobium sp. Leo170]TAI66396.1 hypothetical protein CWO89_08330 [Bradyrhizobium sp. Leo170]
MLFTSYVIAAAAMIAAALYLILRLRLFVTTTTMLVGSLLLIYGPAALSFTLSSGQFGFLIRPLLGNIRVFSSMFPLIKEKIGDIDPVIISLNFSLALMYVGVIVGIELVGRLFFARATLTDAAVAKWSGEPVRDEQHGHLILLIAISVLFLFMLFVSVRENHLGTIQHFYSIKGDNDARDAYRAHFADSPSYVYRVLLSAVAPMLVIWGFLAGTLRRRWPLVLAAVLLFLVAIIGKIELLSKAPPAFFLIQIALAGMLTFTNRISWRATVAGALVVSLLIYTATRLIVILPEGASFIETVYSRVFEMENETLVENFAVFPALHPFMWGANIRPIAILTGVPYVPSYGLVGYIWHNTHVITSPTLFIADAWTDFSYVGVFVYSIIAGAICRGIDLTFLARGKSVVAIAVLSATFLGLFTLLTTALNTALFSGGLLLAPILAVILMTTMRMLSGPRVPLGKPGPPPF